MIKLYGNPASTCTRKVLMTLGETETPFEMNVVDFSKGEHKQEPHTRRQPFGRIPAIEDDGFELFESRAIMRYIAEKTGSSLLPRDLRARARVEQWISVETSEFSIHAMKFIYEHVFKRPQAPAVLEAAGNALTTTAAVLDKHLAGSQFIVGGDFTLADVAFMPYVEYAMMTPAKEIFAKHASFTKWWNAISARPTWRKAIGKA
ncbi:MAG TPA: glutathione S-transferase N-terminal domain-containing protein [Polyangiaceae bacterium]|jgi:glutathione S-transferase